MCTIMAAGAAVGAATGAMVSKYGGDDKKAREAVLEILGDMLK